MPPSEAEIEYYAPCPLGVESALVQELEALGARRVTESRGGARFFGDRRLGYECNLWLRSAIRVQELLLRRPARGPDQLYRAVQQLDWTLFMEVDQTLAVDASVTGSAVTHSKFAALRTKDAIVDQFKRRVGSRPNVDTEAPDLPLKILIRRDELNLYRNLSGQSLHKRGWRPIQVKSPLNEALAAGLLIVSGWDRRTPVVDPMCGSGTFLIEAALMAMDRAPGLGRRFAFERFKDFDRRLWRDIRVAAERRVQKRAAITFEGADHHAGALQLARRAASDAGVLDSITLEETDVRDFVPSAQAPFVIVNPPYGHRLGDEDEVRDAWEGLGNFLHQRCAGGRAFVLSGSPELTRLLGLRARRKLPVRNGPIDCRLVEYEIHDRHAGAERAD